MKWFAVSGVTVTAVALFVWMLINYYYRIIEYGHPDKRTISSDCDIEKSIDSHGKVMQIRVARGKASAGTNQI